MSAGFDARSATDPSSILFLTKQLGIGAESAYEFATARPAFVRLRHGKQNDARKNFDV